MQVLDRLEYHFTLIPHAYGKYFFCLGIWGVG